MIYITSEKKISDDEKSFGVSEPKRKTIRSVILARVSSREQLEKKFSIPEIQIPECKTLIKEKGWKLVNIYIDGGYDGNTFLKRPGLQKMLKEDINTYDVVVVYSFDRLVRDDPYTEAEIYKILDMHKKQTTSVLQRVEIMSPEEYDPKSLNVATHRRFRSMQVAYDSLIRRERFMISKEKLVMKGKHISGAPYGYEITRKIDPKDSRRNIGYRISVKEEVLILQRIFRERVLMGKSYRQIAFSLNKDGIKVRNGNGWSGSRISQVLKNPFPAGYIVWNKSQQRKYGDQSIRKAIPETEWKFIPVDKKLEKYYRPVIDKELFQRAQKIRRENFKIKGRAAGSSNILVRLAKCPLCSAPMVETGFYKVKGPLHKKGYYQCSRWSNKHLCTSKRYPSSSIKTKVLEKVKAFLNDPQIFKEYLEKKNIGGIKEEEMKLKSYDRKLRITQKDIKSLNFKYLRGKIKEKYYPSLLQDLEEKEKELIDECAALKREMQDYHQKEGERKSLKIFSEEIKGRFENLDFNQIKLILRILVKEVIPNKIMQGKGVKGNPRVNNPIIIWNNPAIMERECAFPRWR